MRDVFEALEKSAQLKRFPNVTINEYSILLKQEMIKIGEGSRIDNFVRLEGGEGIVIGRFSHLASGCSIHGGGSCTIGDFTGIAQGVKLVTGIGFPFRDKFEMKDFPEDHPYYEHKKGSIEIGDYCLIGCNAVIFPGVKIGDGAVIGAGSVVADDVPDWTLVYGSPAVVIKRYKGD